MFAKIKNLGGLIDMLVTRESLQDQAHKANSKVTQAAERYTMSGYYALLGCQYQSEAIEADDVIHQVAGVDRLQAMCEADGARLSSQHVRQLRGRWCETRDKSLGEANKLTVEEFVQELTRLRSGDKPSEESPVLRVEHWSDLAIGIAEDGSCWAVTPAPAVGEVFPKSKACRLPLSGSHWKAVLTTLAEATDPYQERRDIIEGKLQLNPPPKSQHRDPKARTEATERAIRAELPTQKSIQSKGLGPVIVFVSGWQKFRC